MKTRMNRYLVHIYFGDDLDTWPMPEDILHMILEMSGLIRHGSRSASFVIWSPRRSLRFLQKSADPTDAQASEEKEGQEAQGVTVDQARHEDVPSEQVGRVQRSDEARQVNVEEEKEVSTG